MGWQWKAGAAIAAIVVGAWVSPGELNREKVSKHTPIPSPLKGRGIALKSTRLATFDRILLAQKTGGSADTRPDVTRSGRLQLNDSTLISNGSLATSYQLSLSQQSRVTLELKSDDFDAYLRLLDAEGNLIAENDDRSDFNFNSRLDESLDAGNYTVLVSTYGVLQQGKYDIGVMGEGELSEVAFPVPTDSSLNPLDVPQAIASLANSPAAESAVGTSYRSVVQVYVGQGSGSGSLLTSEGLLLTNFHVLTDGEESTLTEEPIYIGVALEPDRAVTPLFLGTVERSAEDKDLALVKISSDLLGTPLPQDLSFDTLPIGDAGSVSLGDRVIILGFPGTTSIQAGGGPLT